MEQGTSPEVAFWESVRDSDDPAEIEAYLKAYPDGQFAPLARIRLDKLKQATDGAPGEDSTQESQAGGAPPVTPSDTITPRVKLGEIPDTRRAMLGVRIAEIPASLAKGLGLTDAKGAIVTELVPNSPAQSAGIRPLDIIVAIDGKDIEKMWQLPQRVGAMTPGSEVSVAIRRPAESFTELSDRLRGRADQGDADAAFSLGWIIESGAGTAKNDEEAARWYRKAADQAQAEAAHRLGVMYVDGRGVPKNPAEAVKWYRLATDKNHVRAITSLALLYEIGAGVAKDELEASRLYRKAADQGDSVAMYQLGKMYLDGRGVANDDAEAIIWLRKAADDGNSNAVTALGLMYEQGRGVFNDDGEAVRLYRQAADLNNSWAMYSLARMHTNGRGVAKDETEAFRWYRKAADLGDSDSMYQLGRAYNDGLGTEKNPSAAADWIFKALQAHNSFTVKEMTTNADAWDKEFRRELQKRMQQAGDYNGKIDGSFGAGTKRAIEAFAPPAQ
jgi:TPR repeat protein